MRVSTPPPRPPRLITSSTVDPAGPRRASATAASPPASAARAPSMERILSLSRTPPSHAGPAFFAYPTPKASTTVGFPSGAMNISRPTPAYDSSARERGGNAGTVAARRSDAARDRRPDVSWTCSETRVAVMVRGVKTRDLTTLTAREGRGRRAARRRGVARGCVDAGDDAEAIARDTSRRVARNGRARRLCARTAGTFPRHLASCRERDTTIIRPSVSSTREASVVASARSRVDSSSPRRRRARARVARTDLPRDLHVLLDVRRRRRHRRRASRLLRDHARHDRRRASRIFVQADARAHPREPSRPVRLASADARAHVERERRPRRRSRRRRLGGPLVRDIVRKRPHSRRTPPPDEQRRSDAADSPGDPQRALPAPGYRDGGTPAPPIRPVRGALRPISTRIDTTASPRKRVSRTAARARDENAFRQHPNLSLRRLFPPAVARAARSGDGRERRVARGPPPRTHPLHRRVVSFPRLPRLPDPLRPPRRPLRRRRRLLRVALHPRHVRLALADAHASADEMPLHQIEPGFDPPSESAREPSRWRRVLGTLVDGPPSSLSPSSRGARRRR